MKKFIVGYIVIGIIAGTLVTGMDNAQTKTEYPELVKTKGERMTWLGHSISIGFVTILFWPIGLPFTFLTTGFAHDGFDLTWN